MPQERSNYCLLIGLNPYKEASYSAVEISKRIDTKQKKWQKDSADNQNSLDRRFKASQLLNLVSDMREVMGSNAARSSEFESGRKLLQSKASKLKKDAIILHDGRILLLPGAEDELAKRLKWDDVNGAALITASGINPAKPPVPVAADIKVAYDKIAGVCCFTPMEVLNTLIEMPELEIGTNRLGLKATDDQIRTAFEAVEKRINTVRNGMIANQDAYIQCIRSLKMVLTPDEKLRLLIAYGRCQQALGPAMDTMDEDAGQPFTSNYLDSLLSIYARNAGVDTDLSIAILEEYCYRKRYLANFSRKDSQLTICPHCKGMIEDSEQTIYCPICGGAVKTVCPRCGMHQLSTNQRCVKCGFDFTSGLDSARKTEETIRAKVVSGAVREAAALVEKLHLDFPSFEDLDALQKLTSAATARYDATARRITDDYQVRNLYNLKTTAETVGKEFPNLLADPAVAAHYKEACSKVEEADRLCTEAAAKSGDEAMDLYIRAADRCPDHPDAMARMKDFPPDGPADATIQTREDTVVLRYAVPADRRGMTFCIYRCKGTLPEVDQSTVPLAEIPGGVFQDKTLDPGADYYYKVFAKRWGILSRDYASCGPAIVFREVESAVLDPVADGLLITYTAPRGCSRVRIWRKDGATTAGAGDEVEVQHDNTGKVNDRGLRGGVRYHYLFVAEYDVNGRIERSLGTEYVGETVRYPDPVIDLDIRWNKSDGSYTARWSSTENVALYTAPSKVKMFGTTVPMDDVESWMKKIEPLEIYKDGCRFELPDGAVMFVYPMIPLGRTAIRGRECMITNLRPFRDVEKRISGNECDISMTWPEGAESAIAVVGDKATNANSEHAEKITVSREGYEADRRIRVIMGAAKKKTVTLYAVYDINGAKMNSLGIVLDLYSGVCGKVKYTAKVDAPHSSKHDCQIIVSFDAPDQTAIPPMLMVLTREGIPLKATDGEVIWESDEPLSVTEGKATASFTVPREKSDIARMRLFFSNKEDYNLNRFIHPLYNRRE